MAAVNAVNSVETQNASTDHSKSAIYTMLELHNKSKGK